MNTRLNISFKYNILLCFYAAVTMLYHEYSTNLVAEYHRYIDKFVLINIRKWAYFTSVYIYS